MTNIEVVLSLYEAFARRDITKVASLTSPELLVTQTELLPWGGTYSGHEGLQKFAAKLYEHVDSQVTLEEHIEAGDKVVVIGRTKGTVRKTGAKFDVRIAHVWMIEGGKAVKFEPFIDTPQMLRALEEQS